MKENKERINPVYSVKDLMQSIIGVIVTTVLKTATKNPWRTNEEQESVRYWRFALPTKY